MDRILLALLNTQPRTESSVGITPHQFEAAHLRGGGKNDTTTTTFAVHTSQHPSYSPRSIVLMRTVSFVASIPLVLHKSYHRLRQAESPKRRFKR
jgi:hypothetical protein